MLLTLRVELSDAAVHLHVQVLVDMSYMTLAVQAASSMPQNGFGSEG